MVALETMGNERNKKKGRMKSVHFLHIQISLSWKYERSYSQSTGPRAKQTKATRRRKMQEAYVKPNTVVFTKRPTCPNGEWAWDTHRPTGEREDCQRTQAYGRMSKWTYAIRGRRGNGYNQPGWTETGLPWQDGDIQLCVSIAAGP